jgi:leader peptidase (prepilin peptidase)/N-methyltransferase
VFEALLAGLFGLLIGSFLNVCIYRWPRDLSVVRPRSACVVCEQPIAWYDNIPILSFLILRGRCRKCQARIHWRYPLVELLTAVSFGFFVYHSGLTVLAAKNCVFAAILIALLFTDLETLILPDEFTIGGFFAGLAFAFFAPVREQIFPLITLLFGWLPGPHASALGESLVGGLLPAGLLWFGGWLFEKMRHKEGLGFGDVKMLAMIGAFLGITGTLYTIILGSLAGSVLGLAFIKLTGKDPASYQLPFGSFLAAAAIVVTVYVGAT